MKDIFIVTDGLYDSYSILAVFSSRYRANKYLKELPEEEKNYTYPPRVEVYPLNPPQTEES